MIINDVVISGSGFNLVLTISELSSASELVKVLLTLRKTHSEEPYALFDGDNHLAGFVIPSKIISVLIISRTDTYLETPLEKAHREMLETQTKFYRSHTLE